MIHLSAETTALLEDVENRINPEVEEDFALRWKEFLYDRFEGDIYVPHRKLVTAPRIAHRDININDAVEDYELMLASQMQGVSNMLSGHHDSLCIRANYGTGILSSLFGAEIFKMPRETNTLPTTRSLNDTEEIRGIVERGLPDLMGGFGRRVFEFGEYAAEVLARYPKISRFVEVYHPDVQGPLDICELLWGGEMFYAMYDEDELVHGMLRLITDAYTAFLKKWYEIYPANSEMNIHWGGLRHRGIITLRDDSAMNLSPDLYEEFAAPYDGELLQRFGGIVHFCGRGDHYIETLSGLPGLYGINMSQPELNDMEKIYRCTVDRGIKILGFSHEWAKKDVARAGSFGHNLSV